MKEITWLDDLGLRATYGITGNSPYVGEGSTFDILSAQTDAVNGSSFYVSNPANSKLSWETTHTINVGIDFALKGTGSGSHQFRPYKS